MTAWTCCAMSLDDRVTRQPGYGSHGGWGYRGVYRLIGLADDHAISKPATITRLHGQDTTGTLYIGQSSSLHQRLNRLRRSLSKGALTHSAGVTLQDCLILRDRFPSQRLAVTMLRV